MILYATTIFLSAFLLFQVQPLIGKYILPWFGGTSSVWTTSLLFFQVALLVGYAYAHLIVSRLRPRAHGTLHIALLAAALVRAPDRAVRRVEARPRRRPDVADPGAADREHRSAIPAALVDGGRCSRAGSAGRTRGGLRTASTRSPMPAHCWRWCRIPWCSSGCWVFRRRPASGPSATSCSPRSAVPSPGGCSGRRRLTRRRPPRRPTGESTGSAMGAMSAYPAAWTRSSGSRCPPPARRCCWRPRT